MVYKVVWTDEAKADLAEICGYIAQDNPEAAIRFGNALLEHGDKQLSLFPQKSKVFQDFGNGSILEIAFRDRRIFYVVYEKEKRVDVIKIWHGAREEPEF